MAWWIYFFFHAWCSTGFQKRANLAVFFKSACCSKIWEGASQVRTGLGQSSSIRYFPGWPAHSPGSRWQADSWVSSWERTQRIMWEICLLLQQGSLDPMCLDSGWVRAFRGNVVGLSPSLLSTKASKFCFQT